MTGERPDDGLPTGNATDESERRLRLRLRGITVAVVLALLVFRVMVMPLIQFYSGVEFDDNGITLGTLVGALLLLLGIEVPSFLSGVLGRNGNGNGRR